MILSESNVAKTFQVRQDVSAVSSVLGSSLEHFVLESRVLE